jgi:hypothetical protein
LAIRPFLYTFVHELIKNTTLHNNGYDDSLAIAKTIT